MHQMQHLSKYNYGIPAFKSEPNHYLNLEEAIKLLLVYIALILWTTMTLKAYMASVDRVLQTDALGMWHGKKNGFYMLTLWQTKSEWQLSFWVIWPVG